MKLLDSEKSASFAAHTMTTSTKRCDRELSVGMFHFSVATALGLIPDQSHPTEHLTIDTIRDAFEAIDNGRGGGLSRSQFVHYILENSPLSTEQSANVLFGVADTSQDHVINVFEFANLWLRGFVGRRIPEGGEAACVWDGMPPLPGTEGCCASSLGAVVEIAPESIPYSILETLKTVSEWSRVTNTEFANDIGIALEGSEFTLAVSSGEPHPLSPFAFAAFRSTPSASSVDKFAAIIPNGVGGVTLGSFTKVSSFPRHVRPTTITGRLGTPFGLPPHTPFAFSANACPTTEADKSSGTSALVFFPTSGKWKGCAVARCVQMASGRTAFDTIAAQNTPTDKAEVVQVVQVAPSSTIGSSVAASTGIDPANIPTDAWDSASSEVVQVVEAIRMFMKFDPDEHATIAADHFFSQISSASATSSEGSSEESLIDARAVSDGIQTCDVLAGCVVSLPRFVAAFRCGVVGDPSYGYGKHATGWSRRILASYQQSGASLREFVQSEFGLGPEAAILIAEYMTDVAVTSPSAEVDSSTVLHTVVAGLLPCPVKGTVPNTMLKSATDRSILDHTKAVDQSATVYSRYVSFAPDSSSKFLTRRVFERALQQINELESDHVNAVAQALFYNLPEDARISFDLFHAAIVSGLVPMPQQTSGHSKLIQDASRLFASQPSGSSGVVAFEQFSQWVLGLGQGMTDWIAEVMWRTAVDRSKQAIAKDGLAWLVVQGVVPRSLLAVPSPLMPATSPATNTSTNSVAVQKGPLSLALPWYLRSFHQTFDLNDDRDVQISELSHHMRNAIFSNKHMTKEAKELKTKVLEWTISAVDGDKDGTFDFFEYVHGAQLRVVVWNAQQQTPPEGFENIVATLTALGITSTASHVTAGSLIALLQKSSAKLTKSEAEHVMWFVAGQSDEKSEIGAEAIVRACVDNVLPFALAGPQEDAGGQSGVGLYKAAVTEHQRLSSRGSWSAQGMAEELTKQHTTPAANGGDVWTAHAVEAVQWAVRGDPIVTPHPIAGRDTFQRFVLAAIRGLVLLRPDPAFEVSVLSRVKSAAGSFGVFAPPSLGLEWDASAFASVCHLYQHVTARECHTLALSLDKDRVGHVTYQQAMAGGLAAVMLFPAPVAPKPIPSGLTSHARYLAFISALIREWSKFGGRSDAVVDVLDFQHTLEKRTPDSDTARQIAKAMGDVSLVSGHVSLIDFAIGVRDHLIPVSSSIVELHSDSSRPRFVVPTGGVSTKDMLAVVHGYTSRSPSLTKTLSAKVLHAYSHEVDMDHNGHISQLEWHIAHAKGLNMFAHLPVLPKSATAALAAAPPTLAPLASALLVAATVNKTQQPSKQSFTFARGNTHTLIASKDLYSSLLVLFPSLQPNTAEFISRVAASRVETVVPYPATDVGDMLATCGSSLLPSALSRTVVSPSLHALAHWLRSEFDKLDLDHTGVLEPRELETALQIAGLSVVEARILFAATDVSRSGTVDVYEYAAQINRKLLPSTLSDYAKEISTVLAQTGSSQTPGTTESNIPSTPDSDVEASSILKLTVTNPPTKGPHSRIIGSHDGVQTMYVWAARDVQTTNLIPAVPPNHCVTVDGKTVVSEMQSEAKSVGSGIINVVVTAPTGEANTFEVHLLAEDSGVAQGPLLNVEGDKMGPWKRPFDTNKLEKQNNNQLVWRVCVEANTHKTHITHMFDPENCVNINGNIVVAGVPSQDIELKEGQATVAVTITPHNTSDLLLASAFAVEIAHCSADSVVTTASPTDSSAPSQPNTQSTAQDKPKKQKKEKLEKNVKETDQDEANKNPKVDENNNKAKERTPTDDNNTQENDKKVKQAKTKHTKENEAKGAKEVNDDEDKAAALKEPNNPSDNSTNKGLSQQTSQTTDKANSSAATDDLDKQDTISSDKKPKALKNLEQVGEHTPHHTKHHAFPPLLHANHNRAPKPHNTLKRATKQ
eukprot:c12649_g2_i1.p1 GENE.c12649_g2_i1~~c12649_g2_i1.p1  ORF type:complete len:1997 (+),score=624.51 c12649_g2_i1:198-5993(+)